MTNKAAQSLGKLGGLATRKKYGKEHYQKLAANMNAKKKAKIALSDTLAVVEEIKSKEEK